MTVPVPKEIVVRSNSSLIQSFTIIVSLGVLVPSCGSSAVSDDSSATGGTNPLSSSGGSSTIGGSSASTTVLETAGTSVSAGGTLASGGASAGGSTVANSGASGTSTATFITGTGGTRATCSAPAGYRNLFTEILGKTQDDVDAKMNGMVEQLFHGGTDQNIYFELGTDQAYIEDIYDNDVRSEGQSYGMFIAVAMGMKTEFDKLWNYAKSCMQKTNGAFSWQMSPGTCKAMLTGQAPDGDEYFAEALMLAHKRWGDATGIDYGTEASKVMNAIATAGDFKSNPAVVTFGPNDNFTDASYVLPLFYSEWACFDTANTTLWNNAAAYARTFFQTATNATTGLAPNLSNFNGSAFNGSIFDSDAWRVPMNIMADYYLNHADPWQVTYAQTLSAFWLTEGLDGYGDKYTLDGQDQHPGHGQALIGINAMLSFALDASTAQKFLQIAWDTGTPTGIYRYYDGSLYAMAMLYLSGKFSLFY